MPEKIFRFVNSPIALAEGAPATVNVTRVGTFTDPRYGQFSITHEMLLSMVANFDAGVYGQDIFVDRAHKPEDGAAAKIKRLWIDDNKLLAHVEWTPYGMELLHDRGYAYLSAEFVNNFIDNETGTEHGPLLRGAALTVRPVIKHLDPIQLSEATEPVYLDTSLNTQEPPMDELKKKLRSRLEAIMTLSEALIRQLVDAFGSAAVDLSEAQQLTLLEAFVGQGKQLAEEIEAGKTPGDIKLSINSGGLSADEINELLDRRDQQRQQQARQLSEQRDANIKLFKEAIEQAEGLDEDVVTQLCEASELITSDMPAEQIKKLAEHHIAIGQKMSVQAQLAARGFEVRGSTRIQVNDQSVKRLEEVTDQRLGVKAMPDSKRFATTGGTLLAENKELAEKVLNKFDAENGHRLAEEAKMLAAGDGNVGDVAVPATFERFVIREALYQLVGLQFVDSGSGVAAFSATHTIPYSYRDTTAAGISNARTYEGGAIARAGVIQTSEDARPIPQKLSFSVTDELRYLTANGQLDWDSLAENARNAVRIVQEDTEQLIFNEQLHAADEYLAVAASNEDLELQADGTDKVFILANFPVVRPRKIFDLQGNQVGSTINPVTVTYDSVARAEYDGTGTQAAGTYYVLDYNLGEIYLVDEAGAIQTPANGTAYTISYSYATNVAKFDSDLGSDKTDEHWDKLLYQYGLRKNEIEVRAHMPNFGVMSGSLMTQIEQAKQFGANSKRSGTDLSADGNLGRVKDVANFKTYAPGLWIKDQRMIIGERGQTRFRMMKPWSMGELENQRDSNGNFTGKKEAYGDQFIVLHTPTQLKRALTSVLVYSANARVARVAP